MLAYIWGTDTKAEERKAALAAVFKNREDDMKEVHDMNKVIKAYSVAFFVYL
jgi:hypothetical protein